MVKRLAESTTSVNNMNNDGIEKNGDDGGERKMMIFGLELMAKKVIILKSNKTKCIMSKQGDDEHEFY